jgi:hypothetical protein
MKSDDLIPETLDSILEGILTEEDDEDMLTEDSNSYSSASPPPATACHTSVIVSNPHSSQRAGAPRSLLQEIFICYEKGRLLVKSEAEVQVKSESPDSCCSEDSLMVSF